MITVTLSFYLNPWESYTHFRNTDKNIRDEIYCGCSNSGHEGEDAEIGTEGKRVRSVGTGDKDHKG